ncbi:hypothetical protein [Methanosarcina mazei]|jgi:hypothetical protein|uniref:Uncharacterized protein n=1 Tax=Methanosarcina mazei TaxID=2209 RepID=A0A0F8GLW4_METMZ|nr:hypothetical protein [Methanosarcina mazei]KKG33305.1 hypothetical protein DU30_09245 [Methanosarcina mazei]
MIKGALSPDTNLKPTLEEYKELGRELSYLCHRLQDTSLKLAWMTGSSKKPYALSRKALQDLDKCRTEAEHIMFSQYPELGNEWSTVFFGTNELPQDLEYKSIE